MPFVNGKFYANPIFGRALERARAAEAGRVWSEEHFAAEPQPVQATQRSTGSAEQERGARWVTINGRHVLMEASQTGPAQQTTGDRIAKTAEKYEGSKAWSFTGRKDDFWSEHEQVQQVCI
jgi:hypothetical protein